MLTLYVYDPDSRVVIAEFSGRSNAECESQAVDYSDTDCYAWTYTPAFDASDGLIRGVR